LVITYESEETCSNSKSLIVTKINGIAMIDIGYASYRGHNQFLRIRW